MLTRWGSSAHPELACSHLIFSLSAFIIPGETWAGKGLFKWAASVAGSKYKNPPFVYREMANAVTRWTHRSLVLARDVSGRILCEGGVLSTPGNVNRKTYSCEPSASNRTRGPCKGTPWSPGERYLRVFNEESLGNLAQGGTQLLSVQLI